MVEMDRVDALVNLSAGQPPALGAKWRFRWSTNGCEVGCDILLFQFCCWRSKV